MKSFLTTTIVGLLGIGGALFVYFWLNGRLQEAEFNERVEQARVEFALNSNAVQESPDDKRRFDRIQLMSLNKNRFSAIFRKYPQFDIKDRYIKESEEKAKEGKRNQARVEKVKERYEWLKGVWDKTVKTGDYNPALSMAKNGVRFEITDIVPVETPNGKKLRLNVLIWGAATDGVEFGSHTLQFIREIEDTDSKGRVKKKMAIHKIEWQGGPFILHPSGKNPHPNKWIPEWPAPLAAGYYEGLPLLPADATKFSLEMGMTLKTVGNTRIPITMKWENVEIQPTWKAPDNAGFEADVAEATDEELRAAGIPVPK